jgi:uncharacterized protein YggE
MRIPLGRFIPVAIVLPVSSVTAVSAQEPPDSAEVRTAGSASRSVPADMATFSLEYTVTDSTPVRAGRRLAERTRQVRDALETLGIPRDSVLTGSRFYWWRGRIETVAGAFRCADPGVRCPPGRQVQDTTYRAREILQVRTHDLQRMGAAIDAAIELGITEISGIAFGASDTRAAEDAALREATVIARRQAEAIAEASGSQLGRVLSLSTQGDYNSRYGGLFDVVASGTSSQAGSGTEVKPPSVTVRVTVYAAWRLIER